MSDNLDDYNFSIIRNCLDRIFHDVELEAFCFDHYYDEVFNNLSRGMQKGEKITLLLRHCRTLPHRMEKLLSRLEEKDPEIFAYFDIRKTKEQLKNQSQKRSSPLIEEILEWKILHHNSQFFLREVDFFLEALATYSLDPSLKLISEAGLTWQRNLKDKLTIFNYKFEHINTTYIYDLHDKMTHFHLIVQKIMGDVDHEDFLYLHQWFLEFKKILWNMLEISDDHIKKTAQALQPN